MTARTKQLRAESRALEATARILHQEADRIAQAAETRQGLAEHLDRLAEIPEAIDQVRACMDRGLAQSDAIARVAEIYELRTETLSMHFHLEMRTRNQARLWRRNREIMRLAWSGKSNAEIAAMVQMTRTSVSRVIRAKLRAGWALKARAQENNALGSPQTRGTPPGAISIPPPTASRVLPCSATQSTGEN